MEVPGGSAFLQRPHTFVIEIFQGWLLQDKKNNTEDIWINLAMVVAWSIWNDRCETVFQNKKPKPRVTARKAICFANYIDRLYKITRQNPQIPHRNLQPNAAWSPPKLPFLTINYDGSFDPDTGSTGTSCILRDFAGIWKGCASNCYVGIKDAEQAKCLALLDAVRWNKTMQLTDVIFKNDLKNIADYVNKASPVIMGE
ncbi:uncharacterized protein LOC113304926 [Papaver somniferum]|uniref:uncharacterized protein LOC113304926 n=1 Tax=Papaver somniferum TaxID=3469 RepID=UPI000E6FAC16|nr:uncharacterized protein LOC113304926 [Papaver somniferum]